MQTRGEMVAAGKCRFANRRLRFLQTCPRRAERHDRRVPIPTDSSERVSRMGHLVPRRIAAVDNELELACIRKHPIGRNHFGPYRRIPRFARDREFRTDRPEPFARTVPFITADSIGQVLAAVPGSRWFRS